MTGSTPSDESHGLRGPTDRGALLDFLRTVERMESLATGSLDDVLDPSILRIELSDGVGPAERARFDIVWTTLDECTIHDTDDASQNRFRWDGHPNDYPNASGDTHFHPPPDASSEPDDVEDSCIEVIEIELVARAVHKLWGWQTIEGRSTASLTPRTRPDVVPTPSAVALSPSGENEPSSIS